MPSAVATRGVAFVQALPGIFYHISDPEDRESILALGLLSGAQRGRLGINGASRPLEYYTVVDDKVFVSHAYIGGHKAGTCDIWAVDIEGLPIGPVLDYCYEGEVVLETPCVEPSRLKLLMEGQ